MDKRQHISTDAQTENLIEFFLAKLEHYEQRIDRLEARLFATNALPAPAQHIYTTKEVLQLLKITPNTLLAYRNAGKINYSKTGSRVWFTQADIDAFLGMERE